MLDELRKKSVHDLRVMAQAFGVDDIFEKDAEHLIQEIILKQENIYIPPTPKPIRNEYDARLMTKAPSKISSPKEIVDLLTDHIKMGLDLSFDEEHWYMSKGKKNDMGTLRMPLRHVLDCADKIL
jgi:hypothetical protein